MVGDKWTALLALEDMEEYDDAFFKGLLKNAAIADTDDVEEPALPLPLEDVPAMDFAPVLAAPSVAAGWTRVEAHTGTDSPRVRVYFDHFSSSANTQRGFVFCPHHQCRKYVPVSGGKREFVAWMYKWVLDGADPSIIAKCNHLLHSPAADGVASVLESSFLVVSR